MSASDLYLCIAKAKGANMSVNKLKLLKLFGYTAIMIITQIAGAYAETKVGEAMADTKGQGKKTT